MDEGPVPIREEVEPPHARVIPSRADDEGPPMRRWVTLNIKRKSVSLCEVPRRLRGSG